MPSRLGDSRTIGPNNFVYVPYELCFSLKSTKIRAKCGWLYKRMTHESRSSRSILKPVETLPRSSWVISGHPSVIGTAPHGAAGAAMAILVGCRRSAASTLLEIQQGRFWMDYGKVGNWDWGWERGKSCAYKMMPVTHVYNMYIYICIYIYVYIYICVCIIIYIYILYI